MKRFLILIAAGVASALSAGAQTTNSISINAGDFKKISIAENMEVILLTGAATTSDFNVSKRAGEWLDIKLSGTTLNIEKKQGLMPDTVYLTVHNLEQLSLGENTIVHINGLVTTPELQLFIENNSKAYIRTTGQIKAHSTSDAELTVEPLKPNGRTDSVVFF